MILLSDDMLSTLVEQADVTLRRRKNLNIHSSYQDGCQRFLNAIHKNSYIPPHRHKSAGKSELLVAVRGSFSLITFDETGRFVDSAWFGTEYYLDESCSNVGVEIPSDVWHTVISLQENSILLEVKEGPFNPDQAKELAPWAPKEDSDLINSFLAKCYEFSQTNKNVR